MTSLPARDLGTVRLAELFAGPGCPLCHHRDQAVRRYIEGFMYESVNDVAFRATLDAARGFCGSHTSDVLVGGRHVSGGMLGSAILFGAILRVREHELRAVREAGALSRGRRSQEARRPAACMVCAEAASVDSAAVNSLMRLASEPEWADAIGGAAVCLEHLGALMASSGRPPGWSEIEDRQLARIGELRELVQAFAHNASHDRRHLTTDEQTAAPAHAAAFLGGSGGSRPRSGR